MKRAAAWFMAILMMLQVMPVGAENAPTDWYQVESDEVDTSAFHAVRFMAEGNEVAAVYVANGGLIGQVPEAPEVSGKLFLGWYRNYRLLNESAAVTEDLEYAAVYTEVDPALEELKRNADFLYEDAGAYAKIAIFGTHKKNQRPTAGRASVSGAAALEAWAADNIKNNTRLKVEAVITAIPEEGSLAAWKVQDGKLSDRTGEGLLPGDRVVFDLSMKGAKGIALGVDAEEEVVEIEGALYANEDLYITGKVPGNGIIDVQPVTVEIAGEEVISAYDIKIYANANQQRKGKTWQPAGKKVQVHFRDDRFEGQVNVYHIDGGAPEYIDTVEAQESWVTFEAGSFSIYAVTRTLEKIVTAGDGNTYLITLTYTGEADLPEDAALAVQEMEGEAYADYVGRAAASMAAGGFTYARVFDISIVDGAGAELQPNGTVEVKVELINDGHTDDAFSVVHFAGEDEIAEQVAIETEGDAITFVTDGFSAYAIVQGPSEIPAGYEQITSMSRLAEVMAGGVYLGHTAGYYMTDREGVASNNAHGIAKTKPAQGYPHADAAQYCFEAAEGGKNQFYLYCLKDGTRYYIQNSSNEHVYLTADTAKRTAFTVNAESNGRFSLRSAATNRYLNHWQDANGTVFAAWTDKNAGSYFYLWRGEPITEDPWQLSGKSYGLLYWNDSVYGKALMAAEGKSRSLAVKELIVMSDRQDNTDKLFVPNDSDISMWTFRWVGGESYSLQAGSGKYLSITDKGLALSDELTESCKLQVVPGTGTSAGRICLKASGKTLTYSGTVAGGFTAGGKAGMEWLYLVGESELTSEYVMPYAAAKVSVSSAEVTNGARVVLYTRAWNDTDKKYEFYVVDHDGTLVHAFENGDDIEWLDGRFNTKLWNFVEYYWEDTQTSNDYYELYNPYSDRYLTPQVTGGQILSANPIGIHLNGRHDGYYQTTILAWDETNYAYAGLKVENGRLVTCPRSEAMDFYFAIVRNLPVDDALTTVPTVDHTRYGITMKIVDFGSRTEMSNFLGNNAYTNGNTTANLLSTNLGSNGYPTAKGGSLSSLFSGARTVNHLFIASTYSGSGYFEYDSTQNFAHLDGSNFTVYREIGTMDGSGSAKWYWHGQFMPFNDLEAGVFASLNKTNTTYSTGADLPDGHPRKHERLYLVRNPNYYYGMEIEASFTQTPGGLDAWGHDIIYEFTGDDDFWLYVDGELIIDLGGIHDALPGSVNYSTGQVNVNGKKTTLRALFEANYKKRNPQASQAQVKAYLAQYFEEGSTVFRDYSTHTMKIFYMERGAGAANLHMRFNLASVRSGTVELSKELEGIDKDVPVLAEFPYQIWYKLPFSNEERLLKKGDPGVTVRYRNTETDVKYLESLTVPGTGDGNGKTYEGVFMLRPGETAVIGLPDERATCRIVECGVNPAVYESVTVNGTVITGTDRDGDGRRDFDAGYASSKDRPTVKYVNRVRPDALRTLRISKKLYREDGITPLQYEEDNITFSLRLYLGGEFDAAPSSANMYSYRILDREGRYCAWNAAAQTLESTGWTSVDGLTKAQKERITFSTSVFGAIAKIPAFYTIEVPNMLAGTTYRVQERPTEIPDGYSFSRYEYNGAPLTHDALTGVNGTVKAGENPQVDVCNLRGWGLRINKTWSDADYMITREPTYFAVFVGSNEEDLTLLPADTEVRDENGNGTTIVRQLAYGQSSIYWYFPQLPQAGTALENYYIREVKVVHPTVDPETGHVTGYETLERVGDEGITLTGQQKGESSPGQFTYNVTYARGTVREGSQMRIDSAGNNRPGVRLRKTDWAGKPLAGAVFELKDAEGSVIGTFTSAEDGTVTTAFLKNDGSEYTLTETKAPQGYRGPKQALILSQQGGNVAVKAAEGDQDYYSLNSLEAMVTLRNRPFTFRAVKIDADSREGMAGVVFQLHRQVAVDGVTGFDTNPMAGYEHLVTDSEGNIPKLDGTLPAGTYELRETQTLMGYHLPANHIHFTISPTGIITLGTHPEEAELTESAEEDGPVTWTLTVVNRSEGPVAPTDYRSNMLPYLILILTGALLLGLTLRRGKKSKNE